jgi:hypothetical protein
LRFSEINSAILAGLSTTFRQAAEFRSKMAQKLTVFLPPTIFIPRAFNRIERFTAYEKDETKWSLSDCLSRPVSRSGL